MVIFPAHRDGRVVPLGARVGRRQAMFDVFQARIRKLEGRRFGREHEKYRRSRIQKVGRAPVPHHSLHVQTGDAYTRTLLNPHRCSCWPGSMPRCAMNSRRTLR